MDNLTKKTLREILISIVEEDDKKKKILDCENIDIVEDLEFDSLDIMSFVVMISEKFDIQISEYEDFIENLYRLEKLSFWIDENMK